MKIAAILFTLFLFSNTVYAEVPTEIQGVWIPDIEKTIELMEMKDMAGIAFMKNQYLPNLKRIISEKEMVSLSGKREIKADIAFKERQGKNTVMILSGKAVAELIVIFVPQKGGRFIMKTENEEDRSGSIMWKKE